MSSEYISICIQGFVGKLLAQGTDWEKETMREIKEPNPSSISAPTYP